MLTATLIGLAVGAAFGLGFWLLTVAKLDRLNQGMASSLGLVGLIAACLWADGWVLAGIIGFVAAMTVLLALQARMKG